MQGFGDYEEDGTASAMKARDHKDATDLVVGSHWEGSGVHPTLSRSSKKCGGIGASNQELFSEKGAGLVPAIYIDRSAFNDGKNAQFNSPIEEATATNSLVARGPHAVATPMVYEHHPNDSRVTGPHDVAQACVARYGTGGGNVPLVQEAYGIPGNWVNRQPQHGGNAVEPMKEVSPCLTNGDVHAAAFQASTIRTKGKVRLSNVSPTIKAETKSGDTEPKVIAFEPGITKREGKDNRFHSEMSPTIRKHMGDNQVAVAVDLYNQSLNSETSQTIRAKANDVEHTGAVMHKYMVRRLLPEECEVLQGFPPRFTKIPWRGKSAEECPDGLRYKVLGNSMAVNCMRWIGQRIKQFS